MFKIEQIEKILLDASEIIRDAFYSEKDISYKEDGTPVTNVDLETNEFLREHLTKLLPNAGWLSEEDSDNIERLSSEYIWVVDPIDGTKSFINKIPEVSISVGLVKDNKPVFGAVVNPIKNQGGITTLWEGNKFWGFDEVLPPDSKKELKDLSVIVSIDETKDGLLKKFEPYLNLRPVGSVAYKLLRVAYGIDDLYFSLKPKSEWDICGGFALLSSKNKKYKRFDNIEIIFNQKEPKILSGAIAGEEEIINEFLNKFRNLGFIS